MSDDTPAVKSLHAVKTTKDDAYREAFLRNVAKQIIGHLSGMEPEQLEELTGWLRTVWLEARGEPWGVNAEEE